MTRRIDVSLISPTGGSEGQVLGISSGNVAFIAQGSGGIISGSILAANVVGLNTSNVLEVGSNLYFTNARVIAAVANTQISNLSVLGNIVLGGNLVTNSIVISGTSTSITVSSGNINASNVNTNSIVSNTAIISGNINSTGNIIAATYYGDGSKLTGVAAGNAVTGNLNVSGNIISNVALVANSAVIAGNIIAGNIVTGSGSGPSFLNSTGNLTLSGTNVVLSSPVTYVTSNLNVTGNVIATTYYGDGSKLTGVSAGNAVTGNLTVTGNVISNATIIANAAIINGNITAGNVIASGTGTGSITTTANLTLGSSANIILSVPVVYVTSNLNVAGNVIATTYYGDGSKLTGVAAGNVVTGNLNVSGNIISNTYVIANGLIINGTEFVSGTSSGTIISAANVNVSNVNANVIRANTAIITGNANVSGNVVATYFVGNGALLTNIVLPAGTLNSVTGNLTVTGNVIANAFISNSTGVATLYSTTDLNINSTSNVNITAANINFKSNVTVATGNIYAGNVITTGTGSSYISTSGNLLLSATGNLILNSNNLIINSNTNVIGNVIATTYYGDGSKLTGIVTSINNINGNLTVTGNVVANAYLVANGLVINGTEFVSGTSTGFIIAAGNVNVSNVNANVIRSNTVIITGNANVSGNVVATYFVGNGALLTNIVTSVNNINGNLTVTGNVIANAAIIANSAIISGNISAGNVVTSSISSSQSGPAVLSSTNDIYINTIANVNIVSGNLILSPNLVIVSANIISSANITALRFIGNGAGLTGITSTLTNSISGNLTVTGNLITTAAAYLDNVNASNVNISNTLSVLGNVNATGNINAGNIYTTGLYVNGASVVNGPAQDLSLTVARMNATVAINTYYLNANVANLVFINATDNVTTTGNVIATAYYGDGSKLTGIVTSGGGASYSNAVTYANVVSYSGNAVYQSNSNVTYNGNVLYQGYIDSQIIAANSSYVSYNLNNANATNSGILVSIEGLVQIPGVDYGVDGQTLTLTSAPATTTNIEVRYTGYSAVSRATPATSMDILSSFLLMGA